MSTLDSTRALNLTPALRPVSAVDAAAPTKNPDKSLSDNSESSKATFSRLLARSQAAAAAAPQPSEWPRSTGNSASPARAARSAPKDADRQADDADAAAPASDARDRRSAAARSGDAAAPNDLPNATEEDDASATSARAAASTDDAHPASADSAANALAVLLAAGLTPTLGAPPATPQAGAAPADATVAPPLHPAATLTTPGNAGAAPAGIDAAASLPAGAQGSDTGAAIVAAAAGDRGLGQFTPPGDPKAALDTTAPAAVPTAGLPTAGLPNAALAALAVGLGKTDEAPKANATPDALPAGASAGIGGHGLAALARSIDSPASATATVSTAVGDPGFHEALAAQVSVFARGGLSKAELHLNPAELGPVSVQILMNGDQARVDFGADRAQTRQVIEAGWAELATSLKDAGFTLSGGGVSEQAGRQASERQAAPPPGRAGRSADVDDVPVVASIVVARPRAGSALDLYA